MLKRFILIVIVATVFVSCQFSEVMVINEDGTGRMSIAMDMSAMMEIMPSQDTLEPKIDSVISFKKLFDEKRDSIALLPKADQEKLKSLEKYQMRVLIDPTEKQMEYEIFVDFNSVEEANNLMDGLNATESLKPATAGGANNTSSEKKPTPQATAVQYSYKNNVFSRDGYIKDPEAFAKLNDSIQSIESFMEGSMYSIKYTFPKRIKSVSVADAQISGDGKTVTFQKPFIAYLKNPDELDLEIVLEEN
tara:strand:+ start:63349 stop:64092 length:744 start_codon:yes stop_codon:yes gene_type:complete